MENEMVMQIKEYLSGYIPHSGEWSDQGALFTQYEELQSAISGVFPCGEGAGYAGGITSAAMDGLRIAEAIRKIYRPISQTD